MVDIPKIIKGGLSIARRERGAPLVEEAAGQKLAEILASKQPPMTTPQGTGLPLMPRSQGMYTPDVPQVDLPRMPMVDKARAAGQQPKYNERMKDLLDSPTARKKIDKLINKGKELNVREWYGTEPLRQVTMDAGRTPEQYQSLLAQLANASQRNPVEMQNRIGSYLHYLSQTDQLPENSLLLTNKLKEKLKDNPLLAEGRNLIELPNKYGSFAQGDIFNRAVMIGQGDVAGALPPNKKLGTFYQNLLGNLKPVTVDVNAVRGPIIERGDPRWLTSKLVEKDKLGNITNIYQPRKMVDEGEMTVREAQQRPGFWEAAPSGSEYAGFEDLWTRGAKRHGVEPAEAQALGWYGSADVTALRSPPENYVDNLERLIKRTADQTGKSPTEVLNDLVTGKGFLYKEGGAVDINAADKRLSAAIERRMAAGGAVDIEAADARLERAMAQRMAGGGRAFKKLEFTEDDSPLEVGIHANKMGDNEMAGVSANLNMKDAGRFGVGSNLARRNNEMHPSTMVSYSNNVGDIGVNANVIRPNDALNDMIMTNLMASYPVGGGRLSAGMHGNRMDGTHRVTGHSLGYNTPLSGGNLNVNIMKPKEGKPMIGAQIAIPFADGGKIVKEGVKAFKKLFAPQDEALRLAQQRAALPVEQGGLALPANNTPMDRAKAMGRNTEAYHGTKQDIVGPFVPIYDDNLVFVTKSPEFSSNWIGKGKLQKRKGDQAEQELKSAEDQYKEIKYRNFNYADKSSNAWFNQTGDKFNKEYDLRNKLANAEMEKEFGTRGHPDLIHSTVYPFTVQSNKIFNPETDMKVMSEFFKKNGVPKDVQDLYAGGNYMMYETKPIVEYLKSKGYDSMRLRESTGDNYPTIAVFNPESVRSKFAAHDPFRQTAATAALMGVTAPDLLAAEKDIPNKADGGKIIKGAMEVGKQLFKSGDDLPKVDRLSMSYRDVTKRVPEISDAVEKLFRGEITKQQYNDIVNLYKPVTPYSFVPKPATQEEAIGALRGDSAKSRYGMQSEYEPGARVGLRLDIPAYTNKGVWVNSIHDEKAKKVAYGPVASVKNADLAIGQNESKRIALGGAKAPYARIKGEWNPITEEEAVAKAQQYLNHPEWRQIGLDPERHSYFYDRATMQPITSAEEVIQVGPLVLGKNPKYGKIEDFEFADGGSIESDGVHMQVGGGAFKKLQWQEPQHLEEGGAPYLGYKAPGNWAIKKSNAAKRTDDIGKNFDELVGNVNKSASEGLGDAYDRLKESERARAQFAKIAAAQIAGAGGDFLGLGALGIDFIKDMVLRKPSLMGGTEPMFGSIEDAIKSKYGHTYGSSEDIIARAQDAGLMYGSTSTNPYADTGDDNKIKTGRFSAWAELPAGILAGYGAAKAPRIIEGGLNRAASAARRSGTPAAVTVEAVAGDLGQFKPRTWQDYITNKLITEEGAPVAMTTMGSQPTQKVTGQGLYKNLAGKYETNPVVGVSVPKAGNLSTNKPLRADVATAGEELGQEAMAAHRFLPMLTNQIKDATSMMITNANGIPLTPTQIRLLADAMPPAIVSHSPQAGGLFVAPENIRRGIQPEFLQAQNAAQEVLGKGNFKIQYGRSDPSKDLMYMMRHQYADEGARAPSTASQEMRKKLKSMDAVFSRTPSGAPNRSGGLNRIQANIDG